MAQAIDVAVPASVAVERSGKVRELLEKVPTGALIGANFEPGGEGSFPVLDPADGSVLVEVADVSDEQAARTVAIAYEAQQKWAETAPRVRAEVLRKAFELMIERKDEIALLMSLENGKTLTDAMGETIYAAEFFRWFSEEAVRITGEFRTAPAGANKIITIKQPVGVTMLITPWNFPAAMITRKVGPAIAAGCASIVKPAAETPLTALYLGQLLLEAGLPAGVVNVLTTHRPRQVTADILADPRVRKLSFTGSTEVGRVLLQTAANQVLKCSMELGGNGPFIVLDDADVDAAVAGAMIAKMRNGGQACTAANRFFVQDGVHDEFVQKLAVAMGQLRPGHGSDANTTLSPLINRAAVDRIQEMVLEAEANGGHKVLGGTPSVGPGAFFPATVVGDLPSDSRLMVEEIFGPVAPVVRVADEAEALRLANASEYGLVGYVFSGDLARAMRVAEKLEVGMVGVNRGIVSDAAAPFGGVKQSGLGREGGFDGIEEFLETKYIAASW
jgi:succinate-semialdehyde dehydrogenase / glutarate-semialdehyde dehydrogenase